MGLKLGVERRFLDSFSIIYLRQGDNDVKVVARVLSQMTMQESEAVTEVPFVSGNILAEREMVRHF